MIDHGEIREQLELAAVQPGGLDRLAAGDTPEAADRGGPVDHRDARRVDERLERLQKRLRGLRLPDRDEDGVVAGERWDAAVRIDVPAVDRHAGHIEQQLDGRVGEPRPGDRRDQQRILFAPGRDDGMDRRERDRPALMVERQGRTAQDLRDLVDREVAVDGAGVERDGVEQGGQSLLVATLPSQVPSVADRRRRGRWDRRAYHCP